MKEIAEAFSEKYHRPVSDFDLSITLKDTAHVKGTVRFKDEMGGALWFGAEQNQKWVLVFDGNGIIDCISANKYSFSKDMIPGCVDKNTGNQFIKR